MPWKAEVVIPVYADPEGLAQCLEGLAQQDERAFRVWVCVDGRVGPHAEVVERYRTRLPTVHLLHHPGEAQRGRAATRNLALPHIEAPFTLFLDADLQPLPDWVRRHLRFGGRFPDTAAVGHLCYTNARTNLWADLYNRKLRRRTHGMLLLAYQFTSGNAMLPTEWWRSVGGFDEGFREYGAEDADVMVRIALRHGGSVRYNRWAVVQGTMRKSPETVIRERYAMGRTTLRRFARKHPDAGGYFHWRRFGSPLFRGLFSPPIRWVAGAMMRTPWLPRAWRRRALDYLTVAALYRGWRSANSGSVSS